MFQLSMVQTSEAPIHPAFIKYNSNWPCLWGEERLMGRWMAARPCAMQGQSLEMGSSRLEHIIQRLTNTGSALRH